MIKAALTAALLLTSLSAHPADKSVVQRTAQYVHKLVVFKNRKAEDITGYGTAFFAKIDGKIVGVTNNHLCEIMAGKETYLRKRDGDKDVNFDSTDEALKVKEISMSMGEDICFFTVDKGAPKDALELGEDVAKLDKIIIIGYPGGQFNVIVEDGYTSDTRMVNEPAALVKCGTPANKAEYLMCQLFGGLTFKFQSAKLYQITPNIGPGFSGSPVVDLQGKVVGIIARYVQPTEDYTNGHGLYVPVSSIKKYSKAIQMVSVTDKKVREFALLVTIGKDIHAFIEGQIEEEKYFLKSLVRKVSRESNGP